jgi:hypothetical protein
MTFDANLFVLLLAHFRDLEPPATRRTQKNLVIYLRMIYSA